MNCAGPRWLPAASCQLYQFQEGHLVFFQNILGTVTVAAEVICHLDSGRYFVTALANEDKPNDYSRRIA